MMAKTLGMLAAAQQTALWVPDCGDEVLMLGSHVADDFKSMNTLSVTDVNTILAFHTYTVRYYSHAPTGFTWAHTEEEVRLVKDPPPLYQVTTCTTPLQMVRNTGTAPITTTTRLTATSTQVETNVAITAQPQPTSVNLFTTCNTSGQSLTNSALVLAQIIAFCGSHTGLATQSSLHTTVVAGGLQMLVDQTNCEPISSLGSAAAIKPGETGFGIIFGSLTASPTIYDAIQSSNAAYNEALWPCMELWNIWKSCKSIYSS